MKAAESHAKEVNISDRLYTKGGKGRGTVKTVVVG
jgi:hypothetical protein